MHVQHFWLIVKYMTLGSLIGCDRAIVLAYYFPFFYIFSGKQTHPIERQLRRPHFYFHQLGVSNIIQFFERILIRVWLFFHGVHLRQMIQSIVMDNQIEQIVQQKSQVRQPEINAQLAQLFNDPFNCYCFQCGRKSKQWVDIELAIFLCLSCAQLYKAVSDEVNIKCLELDNFTPEEVKFLKNGGNCKMREFLSNYDMHELVYRQILQTKATWYYRTLLKEEFNGRLPPMAPDLHAGLEYCKPVKKPHELSASQVLDKVKNKTIQVGGRVYETGSKAFTTIQHKITSGEVKEDAKQVGEKISTTAKGIWHSITNKVDSLRDNNNNKDAKLQKGSKVQAPKE